MPSVQRVLVVGGGICGLTAGVALRQAGVAVDLVEAHADFNVYGVGITQPNNALRALDQLGLARRCVELGAPFPGWHILDERGGLLLETAMRNDAAPHLPPVNGITRPVLHRILSEAAHEHGVAMRFSTRVQSFENGPDGVRIVTSDGRREAYDLMLGCDGLYSSTRRALFADLVTPEYTGQAAWRYNLPRPDTLDWGQFYLGRDSKVGLIPIGPNLIYLLILVHEPRNERIDLSAAAPAMREKLRHFGGLVPDLREQIVDSSAVVYRPLEKLLLPAPWYQGRILLMGDAAHASTPHLAQGASMAIEDATLLGELVQTNRPVDQLLHEFMARRFERCRYVVETSKQIGDWEIEEWQGTDNPKARPGELLYEASVELLETY